MLVGLEEGNELDKIAYSSDASALEGKTNTVVWPKNTTGVKRIVEFAVKQKIDLIPRGGGTGLAGAVIPQNSIVLDFSRMNKILEIGKDYAVVEPGIILDNLNRELKKHNLFFPVIPSSHAVCTIGGMIACNAAGVRAIKYGKMMDWIQELEVVTGNGEIINVNGEQIDDFCGTEGVAGIITNARLRVTKPLNEFSASIFGFDNSGKLVEKVKDIIKNKNVIAVEYMDKLTARLSNDEDKFFLFVEYENDEGDIKDGKEIEKRMKSRTVLGQTLASKGYIVVEDPKIPMDRIPEFLDWLNAKEIPNYGHIGVGIIHARVKRNYDLKEFYEKVQELGGDVSGEHGVGIMKRQYATYELRNRIIRLKDRYDPRGILNRGKVI